MPVKVHSAEVHAEFSTIALWRHLDPKATGITSVKTPSSHSRKYDVHVFETSVPWTSVQWIPSVVHVDGIEQVLAATITPSRQLVVSGLFTSIGFVWIRRSVQRA